MKWLFFPAIYFRKAHFLCKVFPKSKGTYFLKNMPISMEKPSAMNIMSKYKTG